MTKLLNLGCGKRFHKDWVNLDFVSNNPAVRAHNLLNGIPFENNSFDVVYHSHVLEHFNQVDGKKFIEEAMRIAKEQNVKKLKLNVFGKNKTSYEYFKHLGFEDMMFQMTMQVE